MHLEECLFTHQNFVVVLNSQIEGYGSQHICYLKKGSPTSWLKKNSEKTPSENIFRALALKSWCVDYQHFVKCLWDDLEAGMFCEQAFQKILNMFFLPEGLRKSLIFAQLDWYFWILLMFCHYCIFELPEAFVEGESCTNSVLNISYR